MSEHAINLKPAHLLGHVKLGAFLGKRSAGSSPVYLFFTVGIFLASFLWPFQNESALRVALFSAVCYYLGITLCSRACGAYPRLVPALFTLKFVSAYVVLYFIWFQTNEWQRAEVFTGFDPITYDTYAAWIVENDETLSAFRNPEEMGNYPYIINLLSVVYKLFGASVLNAASFNSLLVALAYFYFYRACTRLFNDPKVSLWLALTFICPEILYFSAMPGKEASSLCVAAVATYFCLTLKSLRDLRAPTAVLGISVLIVLAFIRIHVFFSVCFVTIILRIFLVTQRRLSLLIISLVMMLGLATSYFVTNSDYWSALGFFPGQVIGFDRASVDKTRLMLEESGQAMFSQNSVTERLVPYTMWQALLYSPIRAYFYFIIPFPPVPFLFQAPPAETISVGDWWGFMTSFMGLLGLLLFGIMAAPLFAYRSSRLEQSKACFPLVWIFFNLMIVSFSFFALHDRYRFFSLPMWFVAVYLGLKSPMAKVAMVINTIAIAIGIAIFISIKQL